MNRIIARVTFAATLATALIAASIACASPFSSRPSTYIVVGPDPSLTVAPDDMKAAGKVITARLDAVGLNRGVEVGENQITVYYASLDDLEMVTMLATTSAAFEFFETDEVLVEGSPIPKDRVTVLTGQDLLAVSPQKSLNDTYGLNLTFNKDGTKKLADYTSSHVGEVLYVALDNRVITRPTINAPITSGSAVVEASLTKSEAELIEMLLSYGPLPFPLQVLEAGQSAP